MERKLTISVGIILLLGLLLTPARADYFVNTGTPFGTGGSWELSEDQSKIACQFTAPFTGTVTNIGGYLVYDPAKGNNNGYVWAQICDNSNGDAYPGATLGETGINVGTTPGWYDRTSGGYGIDTINLTAGEKYWVMMDMEVIDIGGGQFLKFFGGMPGDATSPLSNGAIYSGPATWPECAWYNWTADEWTNLDGNLLAGFFVEGTPVPLPGAVVLFGSGLLGLAGWRGRRYFSKG